ncbi:MAG TPA: dicarboxylate/amino acid:cation symporter [Halioglobus sp.]
MKAHNKLLLALVSGLVLGTLLHAFSANAIIHALSQNLIEPFGQLFLRLIFMTVVPVVFCGLVLGVYQLSQHRGLGRTASRTLIYTILTSTISVIIGISLVNLVRPGEGLSLPEDVMNTQNPQIEKIHLNSQSAKSVTQTLLELVPKNPVQAAAQALEGEMLALMVFALIFGFALSRVVKAGEQNSAMSLMETIYEATMEIVHLVMRMAPYAVFALVFSTSLKFGWELVRLLSLYVLVVVVGLALQQFVVYSALLKAVAGRSPKQFFTDCYDVLIYAFATASSNATLPKSLDTATEILKLSPETSRFVLTVGSTANQNGTALFEGVTVIFLAQVYGIDLTITQQIQVVIMSILAGIGTAGVPGGSLPLIMILLQQVGIPPEGLGLVLGVDRFLDMCRTAVNVSGDLVIAALVDRKAESASSVE